jgi:predicted DNA-binding transcriptional regulator AlpA
MAAAQSIVDFCADHSISRTTLYELWARGEGPRKMQVGDRVLISAEAAADWRRAREAASAAA